MTAPHWTTPDPEPATGAELLDSVRASLTRYVVLPSPEAETATVLWIVCTHALPAFEHATRIAIHSAVKRCGKSRLLEVLKALCHSPMSTTDISVPALFRVIAAAGDSPPTLLLDEADRLFGSAKKDDDNRELIALLNNGFRAGSPTYRCVGPLQTPTEFSNYAMAAIAGIGRKPDTIEDRAVNYTLRRRLPSEKVSKLRLRRDLPELHNLRDLVAAWAVENMVALEKPVDDIPDDLEDRAQDAWEPLFAVADLAGGEWPKRARAAALQLTREAAESDGDSLDLRLLADIRTVFGKERFLATKDMLGALRNLEDAPWADLDYTAEKAAFRLRKFGVKPRHNIDKKARGYHLGDLHDAFLRYLPAGNPSNPSDPSGTPSDQRKWPDGSETQPVRNPSGDPAGTDAGRVADGLETQPVRGETAGQGPDRTGWTGWTGTPGGRDTVPPLQRADDWSRPSADPGYCRACGRDLDTDGTCRTARCQRAAS